MGYRIRTVRISSSDLRHSQELLCCRSKRDYNVRSWPVSWGHQFTIVQTIQVVRNAAILQHRQIHSRGATGAKLSERWCNSFGDVLCPNLLDMRCPQFIMTRRKKYLLHKPHLGELPQSFHGSQAPEYIGFELYAGNPWDVGIDYRREMDLAKNHFVNLAVDNPVFSTLRRIDVVVCRSRTDEETARVIWTN
jgi:hypothetical protein